jgi:predicted MPP superfamily phosphohydrolase
MVSDYRPALILMTGDYINKMNAISRLRDFSRQLVSKYGIYACFGNWDAGKEDFLFRNTRVTPLRNASVEIIAGEDRVCLVGIDLPCGHDAKSALKDLDKDTFNILLHHSPDLIEDIAPYGTIDLYLAGHTHGGQVRIPFLRALKEGFKGRFPYAGSIAVVSKFGTKYESGWFQVGDTLMYVNRGVGMEGGLVPRMRLFCPPELAVFDIVPVRV